MPKLSEIVQLLQSNLEANGDTENFGIGIAVGQTEKRGIYSYEGFEVHRDANYVNGMALLVGVQSTE